MLDFRIANGCGPTGTLLRKLVGTPKAGPLGIVCWGVGYNGTEPSLNKRAGAANKIQQLQKFKAAGLLTPPFWGQLPSEVGAFPVLGRKLKGHGGLDIALIMQPGDAKFFSSDFYTRYIPRKTEFRTWIYRRRHLGTYEKVQVKAATKIGANYKNGFSFKLLASESVPAALRDIAAKAVDALELDFGAVDTLMGIDGALYILEVNTAPGVEGENRQVIQGLADKIRKWEALKFPRRNGDPRE